MFFKSLGFLVAAVATVTSGYDVACIYPQKAPEDVFVARQRVIWDASPGTETPYVIHITHELTTCVMMCAAYHSPGVKDPLTYEDTMFTAPEFGQNAYSMVMCMAQCKAYTFLADVEWASKMVNSYGFEINFPDDRLDIRDAYDKCNGGTTCDGDCSDICDIMEADDYHPYTIGHYMGILVSEHYNKDGWNRLGDKTYGRIADGPVDCTGSCRVFQDTYGYDPRPDPRISGGMNPDNKYECEGDCRRWQPLQEGDEVGSLKQQEFVAPHIGFNAQHYLREPRILLEDPEYDLYQQSLDVIEEVRHTSSNMTRKDAINLMDNKLFVRRTIQKAAIAQFAESGEMSFEDYLLYLWGISTVEIDSMLQAWKEKVHHDLVRPTTVIKYWDDDMLLTFGGQRGADGPVEIAARDFEAFIRVMPHGEFPSGSSCLCTGYMEFTDLFLSRSYGRSITDFGSEYNDFVYDDMEHLRHICGQSRIWGGMHYPEAVPAGEEACAGLGLLGLRMIGEIRNNSPFPNPWYFGTPRPVCGADSIDAPSSADMDMSSSPEN
jgi:hypothetical protein